MNTDKLLNMLLEAIDYSFLQTDGSYDKTLTYSVIDKIQYIKEQVKDTKVKEVDLEKEIQRQYNVHKNPNNSIVKDCVIMTKDGFEYFAKHFFSLGMLSTITEEDCKLIWRIGDEIPQNMSEEEFFKELLKRYKTQKGE